MVKPASFAHKEMSIFCFSDDQDWRKYFVLPVVQCYISRIEFPQLTQR